MQNDIVTKNFWATRKLNNASLKNSFMQKIACVCESVINAVRALFTSRNFLNFDHYNTFVYI